MQYSTGLVRTFHSRGTPPHRFQRGLHACRGRWGLATVTASSLPLSQIIIIIIIELRPRRCCILRYM